ncbi:alkaline phosphatase family protein [bacterium]|nr:alkaline phosphatase family protein [bacterium]
MKSRKIMFVLGILISLLFSSCNQSGVLTRSDEYVIILSMDGCRWDYPQLADMPNLVSIGEIGIKASSMQPVFPSNTFPTHYSLATGLYPDHHGLVDNSFYDADLDRKYSMGNRDAVEDSAFYGGEPIWVTAETQGVKSASFFWVGSEAAIKGVRPSITKRYDGDVSYEARIDSVISWLELPEHLRPRLIMWYFDQPDGFGHDHGPESPETKETLEHLDSLLGVFMTKIEQLPIADKINVIITSDHGMSATSEERVIYIDDYVKEEWQASRGWTSFNPAEGYEDSIFFALQKAPHLSAWKKADIPDSLHYGTNKRVPAIVASRESGWSVGRRYQDPSRYNGGSHGYNPYYKDMHVIFYAYGPAFKKGYVHPSFESVNVYSLLAQLLNIKPAQTDGDLRAVVDMLNTHHQK